MARAFCPSCGEAVEVGPDGRDEHGHHLSGVEPEPWVADLSRSSADDAAPAPAASGGGEGSDDLDFGSLEAAVAELGLSADDTDDDAFAAFDDQPGPGGGAATVDEAPAAAPAPQSADASDDDGVDALAVFEEEAPDRAPRPGEPDAGAVADATEDADIWELDGASTDVPDGVPADEAAEEPTGTEEPPGEIDTATFTARPKGRGRGGFFRRG